MDWTSLEQVLSWLIGGGAPVVAMYVISLLIENWTYWHKLPWIVKFISPLLLAVLLAFGANVLMSYTELVKEIAPWYQILAVTLLSYGSSQKAYMEVKRSGYGKNYKLKG